MTTEMRRLFMPALVLLFSTAVPADEGSPGTGEEDSVLRVEGATVGRYADPVGVDPDSFQFSEAETRLWLDDHLGNIRTPTRLKYDFVRSGTYEDGFTDVVLLDITKINADGTRDAEMQFFTGEREQPYTPDNVTEISGNPVLGVYMRGDVFDMNRMTDGSWRYFQRRIKLALAEAATVEPVEFEFAGRKIEGKRISIAPYVKDPHGAQFPQLARKRYEFTLSDAVPGTLFEIHTIVPGERDGDPPLLEERLTLTEVGGRPAAGGR